MITAIQGSALEKDPREKPFLNPNQLHSSVLRNNPEFPEWHTDVHREENILAGRDFPRIYWRSSQIERTRYVMTESRPTDFSTLALGEEGHTTTIAGEEDFATHAATELKLNHVTTLALGEEVTTLAIGEEVTTQAIGEEIETAVSGEGPVDVQGVTRLGGPFGAY